MNKICFINAPSMIRDGRVYKAENNGNNYLTSSVVDNPLSAILSD